MVIAPGASPAHDNGTDGLDQLPLGTRNHLGASPKRCFRVPIVPPVQLTRQTTTRSQANLDTVDDSALSRGASDFDPSGQQAGTLRAQHQALNHSGKESTRWTFVSVLELTSPVSRTVPGARTFTPASAIERGRPVMKCGTFLTALAVAALGLGTWPSATEAQPKSSTTYTYYTVSGKTAGEIFNAMRRQGPTVNGMKSFASTTMTTLQKGYLEPGKSCQIKGFALQLNFVTKLPRVANEKALPASDLARWRQFSQMVKVHEATHRSIWLDCAASSSARPGRSAPAAAASSTGRSSGSGRRPARPARSATHPSNDRNTRAC